MGWSLNSGGFIRRDMHDDTHLNVDDSYSLSLNGEGGLLLPIESYYDQNDRPITVYYRTATKIF